MFLRQYHIAEIKKKTIRTSILHSVSIDFLCLLPSETVIDRNILIICIIKFQMIIQESAFVLQANSPIIKINTWQPNRIQFKKILLKYFLGQ